MATTEQRAANRTDGSSGVIPERADGLLPEEEQLFKEFQAYVRSITHEITRDTLEVLERGIQTQIGSISKTTSEICNHLHCETAKQVSLITETDQHARHTITTLDETVKRSRDDYKNLFAPAIETFRRDTQELLVRFGSAFNNMTSETLLKIEHSTTQARTDIREQIKADQSLMVSEMTAWREQIKADQAQKINEMAAWREQIKTDQAVVISKMTRWFIVVTVIASLSLAALVTVLLIHR